METRANYIAVGFFTLAVIMASFAFIYWVARVGDQVVQRQVIVSIRGVVSGLAPNSEVHFNGIRVGRVTRVTFNQDDPREVLALALINEDAPVRADTTATIAAQGLTGVSIVSLKGGTPNAPSLFEIAEEGELPRIVASPSAVADILETARNVAARTNEVLATVEEFFAQNRDPLTRTLANAERFSAALGDNADGIDTFLKSASEIGTSLAGLGDKIDGTVQGLEKLVTAVEPDQVRKTVDNVAAFSQDLRTGGERIETLVSSVENVAKQLEGFSGRLEGTLDRVDGVLGAVKPEDVEAAIADIRETASGAKEIVAEAQSVTKTFAERKDDIDAIISNAKTMSEELRRSSARVDGVLAKLDGFLGEGDAGDVFADVRTTLTDFRSVAKTMQASINSITSGVTRFTNSGLGDIEALVGDARRSISRIDRLVGRIERDPQRFLFGNNSGVQTYQGRPRR